MRRLIKITLATVFTLFMLVMMSGCIRPYDKPELVEITPSQSTVVIPLEGKTSAQGENPSASFYKRHLVYTKRIKVGHKWIKTGYLPDSGRYVDTVRVIVVERKPVVREWTDTSSTGTSSRNQAFVAESKESIGFKARMTASAQIDEQNVPDFLYRYNGKTLETIMDTDVRNYAAGIFTEQCSKLSIDQILINKAEIMDKVRKDTISAFAMRGVTITSLNLVGEFTYLNKSIQTSIDKVFEAGRDEKAQALLNQKNIAEAKAKARAGKLLSTGVGLELKKIELEQAKIENQSEAIAKWNGELPTTVTGGSGTILQIPIK